MLIRLGSSPNKFHPSKMRIWPFPHVYCKKVTSVPGLPPTRAQLARTPFTGCSVLREWILEVREVKSEMEFWFTYFEK